MEGGSEEKEEEEGEGWSNLMAIYQNILHNNYNFESTLW